MGDPCVVCELVRKRNKNEAPFLVGGTRVCQDHFAKFVALEGNIIESVAFFQADDSEIPNLTGGTTRQALR